MDKGNENTRQKILEISQELFTTHGYVSISMREIASACGLSKPGLYYYFTDKQELFLAILDEQLNHLHGLVVEIQTQSNSTREKIHQFLLRILHESVQQASIIRLSTQDLSHLDNAIRLEFSERYRIKFQQPLAELLKKGMELGEIRPGDENQYMWALLGLVYPFLNQRSPVEPETTVKFIENVFFDGLGTTK